MAADRRPLIAGNWKMNGDLKFAEDLAAAIGKRAEENGVDADIVVCPTFVHLAAVHRALGGSGLVSLGAQDCHAEAKGAHTGDVSAEMLAECGCTYVIVGHSERRTNHKETDGQVRAKAEAVNRAGMCAIVCVGETEAERDSGKTLDVVARQIAKSVPKGAEADSLVIAYEPVWAIGTGRTPTPDDAQEVHAFIRGQLNEHLGDGGRDTVRILYGGSMKPDNAKALLALSDVDGGLIGGASLDAESFWEIAQSCP